MAENNAPLWTIEESTGRRQVISIGTLPDDVLLAIFDCHVNISREAWQLLVHVCRRWRRIVFESPRRLNLRLVCKEKTPVRDRLDVWPPLPLVIQCHRIGSVDNIVAALERSDRVYQILLHTVPSLDWEILFAAMQQPFPELTDLELHSSETVPVVPDSFLGGSAPRLRFLHLTGFPFPGFPAKLLLSATHLVTLYLDGIPHSGYFSPEVMVTALSSLTSLTQLSLDFESARSFPDLASRRPPPSTHIVLPVLEYFLFQGVTEYLEDLVARIDAPQLNRLEISFFNDIVFDTPHFMQFISRTPTWTTLQKARISLMKYYASLRFSSLKSGDSDFYVGILCRELDWQLSAVEQVCTSCLPPLSMLEDLYTFEHRDSQLDSRDDIENGIWLEPLHPFTAVKNLYLTEQFALRIGPALQEITGGRTTEILPALQNIFLKGLQPSGPVQEGIGQFVASREVTSCPIAVSPWDEDQQRRQGS